MLFYNFNVIVKYPVHFHVEAGINKRIPAIIDDDMSHPPLTTGPGQSDANSQS